MPTPTQLTAVGFHFPKDLIGKADTFLRFRPEHFLEGHGPILEQIKAPQIATPAEAEREGSWEPRYRLEWWPTGPPMISAIEISRPIRDWYIDKHGALWRKEKPREIDVTPELVRALLGLKEE